MDEGHRSEDLWSKDLDDVYQKQDLAMTVCLLCGLYNFPIAARPRERSPAEALSGRTPAIVAPPATDGTTMILTGVQFTGLGTLHRHLGARGE